jgi:hypothetical protein
MYVLNGKVVLICSDSAMSVQCVTYSTDHGATWTTTALPGEMASIVDDDRVLSASYDALRDKYLFFGWTVNGSLPFLFETPDLPPTSYRLIADTDAPHYGGWTQGWPRPVLTASDRYGVRHEEVKLLVGGTVSFTPADAIYDEGTTIPGGTFAYRETFLSIGGAEDDLRNTHPKTYGGSERRGGDKDGAYGAQAWLPTEVNAPSFGIGYQAEGTQGTLQLNDVQVRVYYTLGARFWDKFVMSYEQ